MNSYTHGGILRVGRRINGNTIEPTYGPEEIIEVLKAAGTFALVALLQIAQPAKNKVLIEEIEEKFRGGGAGRP